MIRIVLAPTVEQDQIRQFAERLRAIQKQTLQLTVLDLENRTVRRAERKAARDCGVRCIDFDAGTDGDVVCDVARGIFGSNTFLYRELDHYHDIDICRPAPSWLPDTFGSDQLAWLLDEEETPVPWNREAFFVIPGNPDSWDVTVPINGRLFIFARAFEERTCPWCGHTFVGRRDDMSQCRNRECNQVHHTFESTQEARTVIDVELSAFAWARCPVCSLSIDFVKQIQQCQSCGRLLRGGNSRHELNLIDNTRQVADLMQELFSGSRAGVANEKPTRIWWQFWK